MIELRDSHLYPMVVSISNDVLANTIDRHSGEAIEFAVSTAILTEFLQETTIRVEHLDTMIRGVCHDDGVVRAYGDAAWPREASGFAPPTTDFEQLLAFLQVLPFRGCTCRCHCDTYLTYLM